MYRAGLVASLLELAQVGDVHEAPALAQARSCVGRAPRELVVIDMGAGHDPAELREICHIAAGPVLVCLPDTRSEDVVRLVEDGVCGFLERETLTPRLLRATVQAALDGSGIMAPEMLGRVFGRVARVSRDVLEPRGLTLSHLTPRERQVLAMLADGHSTREVAVALSYSERTVKTISHDIATKLGARTRTQAVAQAVRAGII
jgi:DNA-binding NarL/FixJ family response regulator